MASKDECLPCCSIEQKISQRSGEYSPWETRALAEELRKVQNSLSVGERERRDLFKSLIRLRDELQKYSFALSMSKKNSSGSTCFRSPESRSSLDVNGNCQLQSSSHHDSSSPESSILRLQACAGVDTATCASQTDLDAEVMVLFSQCAF